MPKPNHSIYFIPGTSGSEMGRSEPPSFMSWWPFHIPTCESQSSKPYNIYLPLFFPTENLGVSPDFFMGGCTHLVLALISISRLGSFANYIGYRLCGII
jgi:hypothetical protein